MTHQEYLDTIRATYPALDRWQERVKHVELPDSGSDLDADNAIFPHHRISEIARISLASAGEHLRLARTAIEQHDYYPSAHFTTLRGAMVGASQAVWVLAPDDSPTRQNRGLRVLAEMYKWLGSYFDTVATFTSNTTADNANIAAQQQWLAGRQAHVDSLLTTKGLVATRVIKEALEHTFPVRQREAGISLWQQMSGDSHNLGWPMMQRSLFGPVDSQTGLAEARAGGDIRLIAEPFMLGKLLLDEGWKLFDIRRTGS